MLRKIPGAMFIAALLLALPGVMDLVRGHSDDPEAVALTPSPPDAGMLSGAEKIDFWRSRVLLDSDYLNRVQLAAALLDGARQTGDVSAYLEAAEVVDAALAANPDSVDARIVAAAVQFGTHDFEGALATAEAVLADDPSSLTAEGLAGDALLEVGRYAEAAHHYDAIYVRQIGPAVRIRQARLAWSIGDASTALVLAEEALAGANISQLAGPDLAFYALQLATYLLDTGDTAAAVELATAAVEIAPDFPDARATLARALAAQGNLDAAAERYEEAVAIIPRPEYLAALGDLYASSGDTERAEQQYATVRVIGELAELNRQVYNRQLVMFFADHDRDLAHAVSLAEAEFQLRHDLYGYDALTWALYKNGQLDRATALADELAGFDPVEPEILYHLGLIYRDAGQSDRATRLLEEALDINSRFDPLQAPIAVAALESLRATS